MSTELQFKSNIARFLAGDWLNVHLFIMDLIFHPPLQTVANEIEKQMQSIIYNPEEKESERGNAYTILGMLQYYLDYDFIKTMSEQREKEIITDPVEEYIKQEDLIKKRIKIAKECYDEAAKLRCGAANYFLGTFYESGRGIEQSYLQAKEYYKKAIKMGCVAGFTGLGHLCEVAKDVMGDEPSDKPEYYYDLGCDQDCALAQYNLARIYEKYYLATKDVKYSTLAKKYYQQASESGCIRAKNWFSWRQYEGLKLKSSNTDSSAYIRHKNTVSIEIDEKPVDTGSYYENSKRCFQECFKYGWPGAFIGLGNIEAKYIRDDIEAKKLYEQAKKNYSKLLILDEMQAEDWGELGDLYRSELDLLIPYERYCTKIADEICMVKEDSDKKSVSAEEKNEFLKKYKDTISNTDLGYLPTEKLDKYLRAIREVISGKMLYKGFCYQKAKEMLGLMKREDFACRIRP